MSEICVVRGAGDSQVEDIVEPLLSTMGAKIERARVLFNDERGGAIDIQATSGVHQSGVMPGETLRIVEGSGSRSVKVTRVRHTFVGGDNPRLKTLFKGEK